MRFLNLLKQPEIINIEFVEKRKRELVRFCQEHDLALLYVYGSLARNRMNKLSDVDVAFLKLADKLDLNEYLVILEGLQKIFEREDIDLTDLHGAPPVLKSRILKHGKLIFSANEKCLARFRYKTIIDYLYSSHLRKTFRYYMGKALEVN
ncbi:hypothetical protein A3H38_03105 [candidate division WOR-1 bacterium RIFCSPLOWO2_02_FULL_46_20]|uniref:Polymerase beta nucleotidyltransferase domain-containing protein n=1 Tax=candidate division WOR-1 bacterium RIFCSPLOWO2_02_FULL_46_20 TaxID=1802567 RepID=A0A1F4R859_UNCSA|nr:MAG: hypothetical protein A3H38_03105 [candidate division WOR-1 bacterium RIFCSPLOWO2_02_FULL_46_20]